ncbi:disease resistance protein [Quercus suber]|uniref:Disease resistance protein n=1 Tax=Quercus suber TaxID=58331 RepID=A0AAW0L604_QUESU
MIQCSKASVLLLQDNHALDTVPEKFLQGFEALSCSNLEELPSLEMLTKLRELDLTATCIANLPRGIENLSELRILNLDETEKLKSIQPGIISKLSCLDSLSMCESGFHFRLKGEEDGQATFEELKSSFNRLRYLNISLNGIPWDKFEDLSWINRMSYLELCFYQAQGSDVLITFDEKSCSIKNLNLSLSQEWIGWFWGNSSSLEVDECTGLVEMLVDFIESDVSFAGLKSLSIRNCPTSLGRGGGCAARCDLLPNLEELHLYNMTNLNSISELPCHLGLRFHTLKSIEVEFCSEMKYLLSCGDFIQTLPNLEVIKVIDCMDLEELFNNESGQNISPDPMVPKLRILQLGHLPYFKTLCRHEETWPCLEQAEVRECKGLKRLPLTNQNVGTIKEIKGESERWDALEWDDDQTKSSLLPFFHPR